MKNNNKQIIECHSCKSTDIRETIYTEEEIEYPIYVCNDCGKWWDK